MERRSKKVLIIGFFVCCLISAVFSLIYKLDNECLKCSGTINNYEIVPASGFAYGVDNTNNSKKSLVVNGFACKLGENLSYVNSTFVLIDDRNDVYKMNTIMVKRPSATSYFNDGNNYDNCGLSAACRLSQLKTNTKYKVGFLIVLNDGTVYLAQTDTTVSRR